MKIPNRDFFMKWLKQNPYMLLVLLLGIVIMLIPSGKNEEIAVPIVENEISAPAFSVESEEARLEKALGKISGVGDVEVLLSLESTATRSIFSSGDEAIIISEGSGRENVVDESYEYPTYLGAVVVCEGAKNAGVRLEITSAVAAYLGLSSSKIIILEMA